MASLSCRSLRGPLVGLFLISGTLFPFSAARAEQGVLRVSMIPETATTAESYRLKQPLVAMLERATGLKVKLLIPTNYAAVVEAMGAGQLDLAYFGGLTYVQARERYGVEPLVQRTIDAQFHSLFITQGNNASLKTLADVKGKVFAYGDVNSTSGHLMPAYNLEKAGVDPDRGPAKVIYTGNHNATILAVVSGKVDAGAVDETVYKQVLADGKIAPDSTRVFFTTPPFYDYVWAAGKTLDPTIAAKVRSAFLRLGPGSVDAPVLKLLRAERYVPASDHDYEILRATAKKLRLL